MAEDFKKKIEDFTKKLEEGVKDKKPLKGTKAEVTVVGDAGNAGIVNAALKAMQQQLADVLAKDQKLGSLKVTGLDAPAGPKAEEVFVVDGSAESAKAIVEFVKSLPDGMPMEAIVTALGIDITPDIVSLINQALAEKYHPTPALPVVTTAEFILKVKELANLAVQAEKPEAPPHILLSWENDAYVAVQAFDPKKLAAWALEPPEEPGAAAQKAATVAKSVEDVFDLAVKLTAFILHSVKELSGLTHGLSPIAIHSGPLPPEVLAALEALGAPVDVIGNKDDGPALPTWTPEDQKALDEKILAAGKKLDSLTLEWLPVKHYTIAGKPPGHTYLKAKGVLMAFGQSWAGDANKKLAAWALGNPQKAKTVKVHFETEAAGVFASDLLTVVTGMLGK